MVGSGSIVQSKKLLKKRIVRIVRAKGRPDNEKKYVGGTANQYLANRVNTRGWQEEQALCESWINRISEKSNVLDIPFGTGRFLGSYLAKGFSVSGVELSQDMIDVAQLEWGDKLQGVELIQGDAASMPFDDNQFDFCVSVRFLGYVLPLEKSITVLEEIRRITSGHAILALQARSDGLPRDLQGRKMGAVLYKREIDLLLRGVGFDVLEEDISQPHKSGVTNYKVFCSV